jgi:hypothetical protein
VHQVRTGVTASIQWFHQKVHCERMANSLPEDDAVRSEFLMADGLLDYFPNALAEVARHSKLAGDKHHPGEPLHWERTLNQLTIVTRLCDT